VSFSPQVQALVDEGHITAEQAAAAEVYAPPVVVLPADPDVIDGRAVCLTVGCELNGEPRPLALRRVTTTTRSLDLPVDLSSSSWLTVEDESKLTCPACRLPSAIQEKAPPVYPRMMVA
jgi:hypothetical protein